MAIVAVVLPSKARPKLVVVGLVFVDLLVVVLFLLLLIGFAPKLEAFIKARGACLAIGALGRRAKPDSGINLFMFSLRLANYS